MPTDVREKVAVITASRADWGIYLPLLFAIREKANLQLHLVAVGNRDYITDYEISQTSLSHSYDAVVVLGDTMAMLEAIRRAAEKNIPTFHIHGGDITGSIDNKIRYAISAFADWHFPSLPEHAERLKQMGYPEERIKVVGPLGIYAMKDADFAPEKELRWNLELSSKPIIIVIQHPVSTEVKEAGEQMEQTLEAISSFNDYERVVFYPNSEPGSQEMIKAIKQYPFKVIKNLPYLTFINLLKYSSVIVGNSSCGLVEAPLFGVPCVDIGFRQKGRLGGVVYWSPYQNNEILRAIQMAILHGGYCPWNPYRVDLPDIDGCAIIVETLEEV